MITRDRLYHYLKDTMPLDYINLILGYNDKFEMTEITDRFKKVINDMRLTIGRLYQEIRERDVILSRCICDNNYSIRLLKLLMIGVAVFIMINEIIN